MKETGENVRYNEKHRLLFIYFTKLYLRFYRIGCSNLRIFGPTVLGQVRFILLMAVVREVSFTLLTVILLGTIDTLLIEHAIVLYFKCVFDLCNIFYKRNILFREMNI